jgi:hypothetical protein
MEDLIWEINGLAFTNCNCDYGCPCQFNALPTDNTCRAFYALKIDSGRHQDTSLDGLILGFAIDFPNPIHEGNGTHQIYIDDKASEAQRKALLRIVRGEDTEPMATHFAVYHEMSSDRLEPVFLPMTLEVDITNAQAHAAAGDIIESSCVPIVNPTTEEQHRAQIRLPNGFEYTVAEMSSGSTRSTGDIPLDLTASYGQINQLHLGSQGVIR